MNKIEVKELLSLKAGETYVLKYNPAQITRYALDNFIEICAHVPRLITIIPLKIEGDINQVKFERKEDNGKIELTKEEFEDLERSLKPECRFKVKYLSEKGIVNIKTENSPIFICK